MFEATSCSQCGNQFGPGTQGYSHCKDHQGYANHYGYTDVTPYEVVRWVSDKTIEIREMDSVEDRSVKLEWEIGGFSAHCVNQRDQKWHITSNPENPIIRIRLGKKGWKDKRGQKFGLSDRPIRFYDYNF